MSVTISACLKDETAEQLQQMAREEDRTVSEIVARMIEEYVQIDRFPGIRFVTGASGRRKALLPSGHAVWGVVMNARAFNMDPQKTADWLRMRIEDVQLALAYYAAYPEEIDARLRRMEEIAEDPLLLHPSVRVVDVPDLVNETSP